ncbi:MAG TPA: helix-turn-helix domain-containing protein, partial [Solirubrobacterales bacterium]|nr:helix-turn-helix domain-containing protein [Solirubrobacterales bacterium]
GSRERELRARSMRAASTASEARRVRGEVAARLRSRRGEIEEAVLTRVRAIAGPVEAADPAYAIGLRLAVGAAIEYGLEALERTSGGPAPIPIPLLGQARLAARNGVDLAVVLRRYMAGFSLLEDFVIEEALETGLAREALKSLLGTQAALLDRLAVAVGDEYARETKCRPGGAERGHAELVDRLLAGEQADPAPLAYELESQHVGIAASGPAAGDTIREIAGRLGCRLLLVSREEQTAWAWLGARVVPAELYELSPFDLPEGLAMALGEPGEGLAGWRLTHRQAVAGLAVARLGSAGLVRYADACLIAGALENDLLRSSLHDIYVAPLTTGRNSGVAVREALSAYFLVGRNVSSAAARLGTSRNTIASRLEAAERRLGRPLIRCGTPLEIALRLSELGEPVPSRQFTESQGAP